MTSDLRADEALRRIRGEYMEMPGLHLTAAQARRLWNLDQERCEALLSALVDAHFLRCTPDGAFIRCAYDSPVRSCPPPSRAPALAHWRSISRCL